MIDKGPQVFHPYLGLPVIEKLLDKTNHSDEIKSLILFAVASHHTTLHQELYANAPDPFFLDVENEKYFEQIEIF